MTCQTDQIQFESLRSNWQMDDIRTPMSWNNLKLRDLTPVTHYWFDKSILENSWHQQQRLLKCANCHLWVTGWWFSKHLYEHWWAHWSYKDGPQSADICNQCCSSAHDYWAVTPRWRHRLSAFGNLSWRCGQLVWVRNHPFTRFFFISIPINLQSYHKIPYDSFDDLVDGLT